jgi:acyl transferase domain-containing protein/acyl carrier protein
MARQIYDTHPTFRAALERCDAIARRHVDRSLLATIYPEAGAASLIDETSYTQPALFAVEYALAELWRSWGVTPTVVAGHSVGEYAAACVAGVFGLEDAIKLVAARGRLMQALPRNGAMVVAFAPEARVARAVAGHEADVSLAAVNGPANVVISGRREAVDVIVRALRAEGVGSRELTVSHAFHSPLMDPMLDEFERVAREIEYAPPRLAIVSNITGRFVQPEEITCASYWRRHARAAVRFEDTVRTLNRHGLRLFVEVGPSPILSDMARQCLPDSAAHWLPSVRRGRNDWTELLRSLAVLYAAGAPVDWAGFDAAYSRRRVTLPSYPFQRQRYWPSAQLKPHARRGDRPDHPIIGRRLATAAADAVFETQLGLAAHAFLKDHRIQGRVIVPGPWYLEMARAGSAATLLDDAVELSDVTVLAPLELRDNEERTVQWIGRREDANTVSFELHGLAEGAAGAPAWTMHASGRARRVSSRAVGDTATALDAVRARCADEVPVADYYASLRAHGIDFGPAFQGVRRLWRRDGEALSHVVLADSLVAGAGAYALHPAMLDAGFQTLGAGLHGLQADGTRMPYLMIGVERLRVFTAGCTEVWAHATLRPGTASAADMLTADLRLLDRDGRPVAELEGVRLRRASGAISLGDRRRLGDWLYHVEWRAQEVAGDERSASRRLADPTAIAARVEPGVPNLRTRFGLDDYRVLVRELDALATAYAHHAMQRLVRGWAPGARVALNEAPFSGRGHLPRVLRRIAEMLEHDGVLRASGAEWVVAKHGDGPSPDEHAAALRERFPSYDAELTLVSRCGERLADVLAGVCDPLQLLFPDGSTTVAERLAQDSPPARAYNSLVHSAFTAALAEVPADCPVRILEIGAGTGGTTTAVLPALASHQAEYVFSDISQLFLARARDKYARYPFVRYEMLDIEVDPARQGFDGRRFDIVLAANVLHATADLERTIAHVRQIMAPGGLLVLLEGTASQRWVDLTYGLTAGWWKFSDHARRPAHPLLSTSKWLGLLADAGLVRPAAIGDAEDGGRGLARQAIVIARNPDAPATVSATTPAPGGAWLILADRGGVGERLRDALAARGHSSILVRPDDEADLASLDGLERLIQSATHGGRDALHGVVHLLGLDAASTEHTSTAELEAAATRTARSALFAVQALAKGTGHVRPRLWLVTRGAQAVGSADGQLELSQSPLWGLGRVAAMEHPEIWGGLVDLDTLPTNDEIEALIAELLGADHEDQVAFRQHVRHVARLVRLRPYQPAREPASFRDDATYLLTGGVGGMGLQVARWMAERGARHLALLARRAPTDAARAALHEIERLGTRCLIEQADVASEPDLVRVLADIAAAMPPIRGIIHAAGIFDDRVLLRHDWDRFARVLKPKLNGAWNLHRVTRGMPLDFFVLFSSAASFMGPVGLANYTAANVFLDALAHQRRRAGLPALSIDWGPWHQVGMAEAVGAVRQSQWTAGGFGTMAVADALDVLGDLLQQDVTQVGVLPAEWSRYVASFASGREPRMFSDLVREDRLRAESVRSTTEDSDFHRRLEAATAADRRVLVTTLVTEHVVRVLGFDAGFALGPQQRFFEIGMDSLTAVELKNRLQAVMKRSLPSTLVFDYPTVDSLATYLATQILRLAPAESPVTPTLPGDTSGAAVDTSNLSEDELTSLLAEKLRQIG